MNKRNAAHRMLQKQKQKPVIRIRQLLADFRQTPGYAISQLKRLDTRALLLVAKALGKRYQKLNNGEEKEATGKLILYIRGIVEERHG